MLIQNQGLIPAAFGQLEPLSSVDLNHATSPSFPELSRLVFATYDESDFVLLTVIDISHCIRYQQQLGGMGPLRVTFSVPQKIWSLGRS